MLLTQETNITNILKLSFI